MKKACHNIEAGRALHFENLEARVLFNEGNKNHLKNKICRYLLRFGHNFELKMDETFVIPNAPFFANKILPFKTRSHLLLYANVIIVKFYGKKAKLATLRRNS